MTEKVYIEIDVSPWMDADGVLTTVWFGDACEPCYEERKTYEQLITQELEAHTVREVLTNDNIGSAEKFVVALEEAAVFARKHFEELKK